eukprot:m.117444 g.117444  ORF g.117444 m.117444 type:complete len:56 (-) comp28580_c0_seq1:3889-4056(-)
MGSKLVVVLVCVCVGGTVDSDGERELCILCGYKCEQFYYEPRKLGNFSTSFASFA